MYYLFMKNILTVKNFNKNFIQTDLIVDIPSSTDL